MLSPCNRNGVQSGHTRAISNPRRRMSVSIAPALNFLQSVSAWGDPGLIWERNVSFPIPL